MNATSIRSLGLQLYLALKRVGAGPLIVTAAGCTALVCWISLIPYWESAVEKQRSALRSSSDALRQTASSAPKVPVSLAATRVETFHYTLGKPSEVEKKIGRMFALAEQAKLSLHQADYKSITDKQGGFQAYQAQFPVIGHYSDIRQFCESVLLAIPFASLDEMSFKREAISSGQLEARLRFTLYLSDAGSPATRVDALPQEGRR